MADSKLRDLSTDFAVKVIKICDSIKGHYSLVNQLERSSTSIGANIHEANYAHSKADFVAKFQIALKECYETEYWLEILLRVNAINDSIYKSVSNKCGTIRRKKKSHSLQKKDGTEYGNCGKSVICSLPLKIC